MLSAELPARTQHAALAVSVLLHPFVVGPLTVLVLTDVRSSLTIAFVIAVPLLILIARNVRSGAWTNYDVSERTQRSGLYWPALALTAALAAFFWQQGINPGLARGTAIACVMMAVAMIINRWLKVSLHMLFGAFSAFLIAWRYPQSTWMLALAIVLLAWSRLTLKRHSWAEVIVGVVLGCAAGMWQVLG